MLNFDINKTATAFYENPKKALHDGYIPTFMDAGVHAANIVSWRILSELIELFIGTILRAPVTHLIALLPTWLIAISFFFSHLILFPACWIYWYFALQRAVKKYSEIKQNMPDLIKLEMK